MSLVDFREALPPQRKGIPPMPFMPFQILGIWLRGLFAIAVIVGSVFFLNRWYQTSWVDQQVERIVVAEAGRMDGNDVSVEPVVTDVRPTRTFQFEPGWNRQTAYLAAGLGLLIWATLGRWVGRLISAPFRALASIGKRSVKEPREERTGEVHYIVKPDGTKLRVECYGPADAPPIVMTHGWGCNSTEWFYSKKHLSDHFRLILWDEPGLGLSRKPSDNNYRLEKMATDLEAVLGFAGNRPAVLVGHSIGGMITLTLCKILPETLARRVCGLVLVHTTYKDPVKTAKGSAFYTAIEKPVLVPLLHITIALWPIFWVLNWLNYFNGTAHRSTKRDSFAGTETAGQVDFFARFQPHARPDIMARGMFGMMAYDATETLPNIHVPTLVIVGDQDALTPAETGRYISQHIPNAKLAELSPARHLGLIEHHQRFHELVASFASLVQLGSETPQANPGAIKLLQPSERQS